MFSVSFPGGTSDVNIDLLHHPVHPGACRLLCLVYGPKFGNAKRFLYVKFILGILSVICI